MTSVIGLDAFYQNTAFGFNNSDSQPQHFNLINLEDLRLSGREPVYNRRSFFKVSIVNGHSKIHYANQSMEITGSNLVFTNPMIPFQWERITKEQSGYICVFTESFFGSNANIKEYPVFKSADHAIVPLSAAKTLVFNELFLKISSEMNSGYTYKNDFLRCLVLEFIHEAQKMQPATASPYIASNASERIAALFSELLDRQFPIAADNEKVILTSPATFANQLNIHVNHLNKALKEIKGQSTSQLINNRFIQEAKVLLKNTNLTVGEVAWSLGFEEPNHFSSFFKSKTKLTPKQFRQEKID
jgi:AraC family transcriptional activator of pobA